MARILCTTASLTGIVNASLELLCRLQAAGHTVAYAGDEAQRSKAEALGLAFHGLPGDRFAKFQESDRARGLGKRLRTLRQRQAEARAALRPAGFEQLLGDLQPDLLLVDGELHARIFIALARGQKLMLLNSFVSIWRNGPVPPPHWLAIPGSGWRGSRVAMAMMWFSLDLKRRQLWWRRRLRWVGCDQWTMLRGMARELGLDFRRITDQRQWLLPFTYRQLPVLHLHAREFEFPTTFPPQVHFAGPMIPGQRPDQGVSSADRAALDDLLLRHAAANGQKHLVYAGFGSFFTARPRLLAAILEAARLRPGWCWVVSAGEQLATELADQLPGNIVLLAWAPQLEVLARADLAITHCGANTVDECALAAVPMLNYPGTLTDMAGNCSRAHYHGIAVTGDHERDSAQDILRQLDYLLQTPSVAERGRQLQQALQAYQREQRAEQIIAAQLSPGQVPSGPSSSRLKGQSAANRR
jgi:UDP:flavonoid glycosyltransferase YjiC (YdhE family)